MNIVVLAGGLSEERDVSLSSGTKIQNALIKNGHHAILADAFMGYPLSGTIEDAFKNAKPSENAAVGITAPDIPALKKMRGGDENVYFGENIIELCRFADIVFMALHGENGENGRIQAAFDLLGIKYTGSSYLASACAMDKNITKQIFLSNGVTSPRGKAYKKENISEIRSFGELPLVIKPCNNGSSIGISIARTEDELTKAVEDAFKYDDMILVEEYIKGREFSVSVLGNKALPSIEIIPKSGFYDYKNKYQSGCTTEICPAPVTEEEENNLRQAALKAFNALGLFAYARMDFIMTEDKKVYCLEANTLPGMTPTSLMPQEAAAIGIDYGGLCEKIIEISLNR